MTRISGRPDDAMAFDWSPDGMQITFASRVPDAIAEQRPRMARVFTQASSTESLLADVFRLPGVGRSEPALRNGREWFERPLQPDQYSTSQIFVLNTRTGATRQLTHGAAHYYSPRWISSTGMLAAISVAPTESARDVYGVLTQKQNAFTGIWTINAETGQGTLFRSNVGVTRNLRVSRDGSMAGVVVSDTFFSPPRLEVFDLTRGAVITPPQFNQGVFAFTWQSGHEVAAVSLPNRRLFRFNVDNRSTKTAYSEFATYGAWSLNKRGDLLWVSSSRLLIRRPGRKDRVFFEFAAPKLALPRSEHVQWQNSRGARLSGDLLYPLNYVPGKRYPLIVDAYPFSREIDWWGAMGGNYAWASADYFVFHPGERAPHAWMNSRDVEFAKPAIGPNGWDVGLDDLVSGVDELAHRDLIDPARVCLYGHSNGGGAVAYFLTMTNRFRCAVIAAPVMTNWLSPALLRPGGRDDTRQFSGGYDLETDASQLLAMSSVFRLHRVQTPTLIAVGDEDGQAVLNSIELYNGLKAKGVAVDLVRYIGQGHVFTGEAMSDFWTRQMGFFATHLGRGPTR
jgi:dipeptidyl aminopeptidase/acylaminoacyl peptidase